MFEVNKKNWHQFFFTVVMVLHNVSSLFTAEAPVILTEQTQYTVAEGNTIVIHCKSRAAPAAQVTWYKDRCVADLQNMSTFAPSIRK